MQVEALQQATMPRLPLHLRRCMIHILRWHFPELRRHLAPGCWYHCSADSKTASRTRHHCLTADIRQAPSRVHTQHQQAWPDAWLPTVCHAAAYCQKLEYQNGTVGHLVPSHFAGIPGSHQLRNCPQWWCHYRRYISAHDVVQCCQADRLLLPRCWATVTNVPIPACCSKQQYNGIRIGADTIWHSTVNTSRHHELGTHQWYLRRHGDFADTTVSGKERQTSLVPGRILPLSSLSRQLRKFSCCRRSQQLMLHYHTIVQTTVPTYWTKLEMLIMQIKHWGTIHCRQLCFVVQSSLKRLTTHILYIVMWWLSRSISKSQFLGKSNGIDVAIFGSKCDSSSILYCPRGTGDPQNGNGFYTTVSPIRQVWRSLYLR